MIKKWIGTWFFAQREKIADWAALSRALDAEASLLAQKSSFDYCRARAGLNWYKLFTEQEFQAALDGARWAAYDALLMDFTLILFDDMRLRAVAQEELIARLIQAVHAAAALQQRELKFSDDLAQRLSVAGLAGPRAIADRDWPCIDSIFNAMPIHPGLREADRPVIESHIRLGLIGFRERMRARIDRNFAQRV